VPQVGIIKPSEFSPANSIEAVVWVAVGGRGTLAGAILGAVVVNGLKTLFTGALPDLWLFALGALFVFVTLLLPRGILGTFLHYREQFFGSRKEALGEDAEEIAPDRPRDERQEELERAGA